MMITLGMYIGKGAFVGWVFPYTTKVSVRVCPSKLTSATMTRLSGWFTCRVTASTVSVLPQRLHTKVAEASPFGLQCHSGSP